MSKKKKKNSDHNVLVTKNTSSFRKTAVLNPLDIKKLQKKVDKSILILIINVILLLEI